MNEEENKREKEIVVEETNGVFPVMIGTARAGTKIVLRCLNLLNKLVLMR